MRLSPPRHLVLYVALALTTLTSVACGRTHPDEGQAAPSAPGPAAQAAPTEKTNRGGPSLSGAKHKDGVHVAVTTDRDQYKRGEKVVISVTVSNLGRENKDYTMWNIGDPRVYVTVDARPYADKEIPLKPTDKKDEPVIPAISTGTLQPGESFLHQVVWDQTIPDQGNGKPAPPGKYTIKATFHLGRYTGEGSTSPIEATRSIEITD